MEVRRFCSRSKTEKLAKVIKAHKKAVTVKRLADDCFGIIWNLAADLDFHASFSGVPRGTSATPCFCWPVGQKGSALPLNDFRNGLLGKSFCPPVAQLGSGYHADSYIGLDALQVPRERHTSLRRGVPCYKIVCAE